MKQKLIGRDLSNTAFSAPRLIIWGLLLILLVLVLGIIALSFVEKEIMPLGTLAGAIVGFFTGKGTQRENKIPCAVCGTTANYHTGDQCAVGLQARRKQ